MDTSHLLSASVTPVVLISACGLITLALYNRLGAILTRVRAFHLQKIELLRHPAPSAGGESEMLARMLDSQIEEVTSKARLIQTGLFFLLAAVIAFLLCSLFAALAELQAWFGFVALGLHLVGLALFVVGIGWAIRELSLSLVPLEEGNACLKVFQSHHQPQATAAPRDKLRIAESA